MFHVDIPKVRGKMAEKGYNMTSLAESLGVSRNTLSTYLSNPGKMPYDTMMQMASILCGDSSDAVQIFFAPDLRGA